MGLEKINDMRKHTGMSIDDLSEKSGVPKGTLSKITSGITKNPSIETVKSIVHAMGFTLDDLDDLPKSSETISFSAEDIEHLNKYHALDSHGKEIVDKVLDTEYARVTDEYIEIAARGGKYKVKRDTAVEWAKRVTLDRMEEDHNLC